MPHSSFYEEMILWNNHLHPARHPMHLIAGSVPGSSSKFTRQFILQMRRLLVCPHELQRFSHGEEGLDCYSSVLSLLSCLSLRPAPWRKPIRIPQAGSSYRLRNTAPFTRGLIPSSASRSRLRWKLRSRALTTTFGSMANSLRAAPA